MKMLLFSWLSIIFVSNLGISQTTWYNQNSSTSSILQDVYFVDQNNGWIAGGHIILHTSDGGLTWTEQTAPPVSIFYVDIFFTDPMNGWACGNDAIIIHTTDGGSTWLQQGNPYYGGNHILYGVYFVNADTGWVVGGDHGFYPNFTNHRIILYTTNAGSTWNYQLNTSGQKPLFCVYFSSSIDGFAASEYGEIMHTSDGGISWVEKTQISVYEIFSIYFKDSNTGWAVGEYLGVPHVSSISKTTDGGNTWNTQTFGTDEYLQDIYFADNLTGWAVGGTIGGSGGGQHSTILHTSNGGTDWSLQNAPTSSTLLGVCFPDAQNGWAVGDNGVVLKAENIIPVELASFNASVDKNNVNLSWQTSTEINNKGFEIERSQKLKLKSKKWKEIAFINGHGTTTEKNNYSFVDKELQTGNYSYKLIQIDFDGTRNESKALNVEINYQPNDYSLEQNYPNPFNPVTTIQYSIPKGENVVLKIYNSLGKEVKTLVNGYNETGDYKINFNAGDLSNGIYYYKLTSGSFSAVKKMILLK